MNYFDHSRARNRKMESKRRIFANAQTPSTLSLNIGEPDLAEPNSEISCCKFLVPKDPPGCATRAERIRAAVPQRGRSGSFANSCKEDSTCCQRDSPWQASRLPRCRFTAPRAYCAPPHTSPSPHLIFIVAPGSPLVQYTVSQTASYTAFGRHWQPILCAVTF
jgi:hypothetical protein